MARNLSTLKFPCCFSNITFVPCCHLSGEIPASYGMPDIIDSNSATTGSLDPALKCENVIPDGPDAVRSLAFLHPDTWDSTLIDLSGSKPCITDSSLTRAKKGINRAAHSSTPAGITNVPFKISSAACPTPNFPTTSSNGCVRNGVSLAWLNRRSFS